MAGVFRRLFFKSTTFLAQTKKLQVMFSDFEVVLLGDGGVS